MKEEKVCCPRFDPAPWDGKTFEWNNKRFIKDKVRSLFYMPINFGAVMKRINKKIEKTGATIQDGMWLSDHTSKWNMDLYVAIDKDVSDVENITMNGKFLSKVYEGKFKDIGIWMKNFEGYMKEKDIAVKKMYMWYTTCPTCAKKYGKNYVVLIGQIS